MYWKFANSNARALGSMHMLPVGEKLPNWALLAYEWADELVFESDPPVILTVSNLEGASPLRQALSPKAWAFLESFWPQNSPLPTLLAARPWAVMIFSAALRQRTVEGVETVFMRMAQQDGKPVHFLETASDIGRAFDTIPLDSVVRAIEALAAGPDQPQSSLERMCKSWLAGDAQGVYDVATSSPSFQDAAVRNGVLGIRNRAWVDGALPGLVRGGRKTLVAVGALHLAGPDNVLDLLGMPHERLALA
jgi:uncharacterized protein YbaP (TraB family)